MQAILLSQAVLDVFTCFLTAALAAALAPAGARRRVWIIALWLAATCPFLANYSAVVLTEVLVTFLATAALVLFRSGPQAGAHAVWVFESAISGTCPSPLHCLEHSSPEWQRWCAPKCRCFWRVAVLVYGFRAWRAQGARKAILLAAAMAGAFLLPLLPWAARNVISLHEAAIPRAALCHISRRIRRRSAITPGREPGSNAIATYILPSGRSEKDRMDVNDLPASAFDSPEEKARVADLIAQYNDSPELDISPEMDRQFAEIARERTRRHPLRTYVRVPFERALTIWFTPRTELLAHRRQILAAPRAMGGFPRRRARHGRFCRVGLPVRGAGDRRSLACLAHAPRKAARTDHPAGRISGG